MKNLLHVDDETIHDLVEGRLYSFPPNEAVEVEDDFIAGRIEEHLSYRGLTVVQTKRTPQGVTFDIEGAKKLARERLEEQRTKAVLDYVAVQQESRISAGKPALPPTGRVLEIINKRGIDLGKEFNLHPAGWESKAAAAGKDDRFRQLEEQNLKLASDNATLKENMEKILKRLDEQAEAPADTPKRKAS